MRRHRSFARNTHRAVPDLTLLDGVVAPRILDAMVAASAQLTKIGVRHALAGALAVGANGAPRATKDVDFLVGDEAFDHYGLLVSIRSGVPVAVGDVAVDPMSILPTEDHLRVSLEHAVLCAGGVPVLPLPALIYLKLKSPRSKDMGDIVELLKLESTDPDLVVTYMRAHAPDLLPKLDRALQEATAPDD